MTFGSLFSGIGGLDLGLERAGMECRFQVEIDPFCQKVLAKHWPHVKRYGDITKLDGRELERVDLLAGGFPCQDLSQAGKRTGIEGSRSGLWFEFARLIGELRPQYVLIENVPGLLVPGAMPRVVGELARLGYVGIWRCFRASEFGASHLRKRVFIVAVANGTGSPSERYRESNAEHTNNSTSSPSGEVANTEGSRSGRGFRQGDPEQDRHGSQGAGFELEDTARDEQYRPQGEGGRLRWRRVCEASEPLADTSNRFIPQPGRGPQGRDGSASEIFPDSSGSGLSNAKQSQLSGAERDEERGAVAKLRGAFAPGPNDAGWSDILREHPDLAPSLESSFRGVADGLSDLLDRAMSNRTKRLSRLGNAVVPQIAEYIGRRILGATA